MKVSMTMEFDSVEEMQAWLAQRGTPAAAPAKTARPALVKDDPEESDDEEAEEEAAPARKKTAKRAGAKKEAAKKATTKSRPAALDLDDDEDESETEEGEDDEEDEAPAAKKGKGTSLDDVLNGPPKQTGTNFKSREYKKTREEVRTEAIAFVKAKGGGDEGVEALTDLLIERYEVESIADVPEEKLGDCYAALLHFKNVAKK